MFVKQGLFSKQKEDFMNISTAANEINLFLFKEKKI